MFDIEIVQSRSTKTGETTVGGRLIDRKAARGERTNTAGPITASTVAS